MGRLVVLAQPFAVIGGDHDQRVVKVAGLAQRVEHAAEFAVDERGLAVVGRGGERLGKRRGRFVRAVRVEVVHPREERLLPAGGTTRRLEFVGGSSSKFWQITVDGARHRVSYGRIGTGGRSKEKTFADPEAAERAAEKLVAAKLRKGYEQV